MRKRNIAGENLQTREKRGQNLGGGPLAPSRASPLVPFVIFPSSSSQREDHLNHQGQVENRKQPVESIVLHPHHSPHSYEGDEDKNRPSHHGANKLKEHDFQLRGFARQSVAAPAALSAGTEYL